MQCFALIPYTPHGVMWRTGSSPYENSPKYLFCVLRLVSFGADLRIFERKKGSKKGQTFLGTFLGHNFFNPLVIVRRKGASDFTKG